MSVRLRRKAVVGAVVAAAIVVSAAAPAGAAPNPYPAAPLDLWGQSGTAYAVEVVGNTAYIGGASRRPGATRSRQPRVNLMAINLAANPPSNSLSALQGRRQGRDRPRPRCPTAPGSTSAASSRSSAAWPATAWPASTSPTGRRSTPGSATTSTTRCAICSSSATRSTWSATSPSISGTTRRRAAAIDLGTVAAVTSVQPQPQRQDLRRRLQRGDGPDPRRRQLHHGRRHGPELPRCPRSRRTARLQGQPTTRSTMSCSTSRPATPGTVSGCSSPAAAASTRPRRGTSAAVGRIWRIRADGDVQAVRFANNNVYFGFHDGYLGNNTLRLLAADARPMAPTVSSSRTSCRRRAGAPA